MGEYLVISLIGMSGSGKTFWSKRLEAEGFERIGCDDLIEQELGPEFRNLGYSRGIQDVAKWMGQPFDSQYGRTSQRYLNLEHAVVSKALANIKRSKQDHNIVIDTTGSVIYLPAATLNSLTSITRVVYLETPDTKRQEMYDQFLKELKPVFWGDSFFRAEGETNMAALARCYPDLLAYRSVRYAEIADVALSFGILHNPDFTTNQFIQAIRK